MSPDPAAIRAALADNRSEPEGPARNARAEQLVTEAERTGDTPLLIDALFNLLTAYEYSSEQDKMFVPFARVLRRWDERPEDFDEYAAHQLHWVFKWVSSGMLDQPHIPLASIEKWHAEMEHRYRLAGFSERAVRKGEFRIARHLGDDERAARAYAAWQAADRDRMSDCHACELHGQGWWQVHLGKDAEALDLWRPVLTGEHTCAHEPHAVLASSLLPLVRLGRLDEARAHHLRGYRLVRPMESMRAAVGEHVEFCALTGNEARALEILAEHPAHFATEGDPDSLMDYLAMTALLMRRLVGLGHGGQQVPGPAGRAWTAAELLDHARHEALALARRFDERNGTQAVSGRVAERMAAEPLVDRLPLGVRVNRPVPAPDAPRTAARPASGTAADDVPALLAEARRLSRAQHYSVREAWGAVRTAAERTGTDLDPLARAEAADHEAMAHYRDPGRAVVLFQQAAELYETAGDRAEAVAARGRGAFATALAGRAEEALPALQEVCEALHALHDQDCATARQVAGALAARARVRLLTLPDAADQDRAGTELEREIGDLLAFAEAHRTEDRMASRIAEALLLLGQVRSGRGEQQAAAEHFARSAEIHHEDGLSWYASEPEAMLARASLDLGDLETAERSARAALDHGAEVLEPAGSAQLHMMLADIFAGTGRDPEAAEHALEAAHWADEAGESEGLGGWARLVLGGAFHRLGRQAEAASVLEAVLPDLERVHGEGQVVQARWWLGECLAGLGEHRDAAEQFLQAAGIARDWEEQQDHAVLANLAADALNRAGLDDQAVQAYQRAEELWRALGRPHAVVRTLRARAWIALREGREGAEAGRSLMSAAEQACVSALAAATDRHEQEHLRAELAGTHRQTGELLVRACGGEPGGEDDDGTAHTAYETALGCAEQAIAQFAACGAAFRDERTGAQLMAAWLEADLGRRAEAAGRARTVLEEYGEEDGETAEQRRSEAESVIAHTARSD